MSRRAVVLFVSILLAGLAAFSVWRYIDTIEGNVREGVAEVVVFRATSPIAQGDDGSLVASFIESSTALSEAVVFSGSTILCTGPSNRESSDVNFSVCDNNPSDLQALLTDRVAAGPISAGQLITSEMFVALTELDLDRLSADIPQGKVAIAINPGSVGAVGGFLRPGDRVNVLATFTLDLSAINALLADPDTRQFLLENVDLSGLLGGSTDPIPVTDPETGEVIAFEEPLADPVSEFANRLPDSVRFTQTVLQDLDVIAFDVGTRQSPVGVESGPVEGDAVVVLEVTTAEAEIIEFVRQNAQVSLVLLPPDLPYSDLATRGVTVDDIFFYVERLRQQLESLGG